MGRFDDERKSSTTQDAKYHEGLCWQGFLHVTSFTEIEELPEIRSFACPLYGFL
jgi:hypothetical protein